MRQSKRKQELAGTNPYCTPLSYPTSLPLVRANAHNCAVEQVVAGVSRDTPPGSDLHAHSSGKESVNPPAFVRHEHHNGHTTIKKYKDSPAYAEYGAELRHMVPPPQRGRPEDERAYTKAPDYVKNYNKTKRPTKEEAAVDKVIVNV